MSYESEDPRTDFSKFGQISLFFIVYTLFWDTASIARSLPSGEPIGSTPRLYTINYLSNFINFSTTRPILDLMMSLKRAHQDLKLCPLRSYLLTLRTDFKYHYFRLNTISLFSKVCFICKYFTLMGLIGVSQVIKPIIFQILLIFQPQTSFTKTLNFVLKGTSPP